MSFVAALEAPQGISNAIRKASRATGTDFSYLLKTAARESAFKQGAKAKTSSAAGLFQFIESTWLKTVKEAGDKFGLEKYTPHIFTTRSGRHYVPNSRLKNEILQLRYNPEISAMMAGAFTQKNSELVGSNIGRQPTQGELYIAHFLGPSGASDLISLAENRPDARADRHFPRAARANRSIFYSRGRPRTIQQVYNNLVKHHANLAATASPKTPEANPLPLEKPVTVQTLKPVIEPPQSIVPDTGQASTLLHNASLTPGGPASSADELLGELGVEAQIVENAADGQAIGLLGQTGSPIVNTGKVAALTHTGLDIQSGNQATRAQGAIGTWNTIIEPADAKAAVPPPLPEEKPEKKAAVQELPPVSRKKATSSRPGLLEQSEARNRSRAPVVRTASLRMGRDFWERASFNGN